jgi:hypothetical protein
MTFILLVEIMNQALRTNSLCNFYFPSLDILKRNSYFYLNKKDETYHFNQKMKYSVNHNVTKSILGYRRFVSFFFNFILL